MELICFDMDNTLVKANKIHIVAFKQAFKEFGLKRKTTKDILKQFSQTAPVMVKKLYPHLSKQKVAQVVHRHDFLVVKDTSKYVKVIPHVKSTLKKLKKKYKIAILSNATHEEIDATLTHAKIDERMFDLIVGHDEVKKGKPAPDMILKAMKKLKIKEGYMVGDSPYDIQAGKKAGLKTIGVTTGNHTRKELKKEKPDIVLDSVAKLKEKLS